jgi:hypothetical protein
MAGEIPLELTLQMGRYVPSLPYLILPDPAYWRQYVGRYHRSQVKCAEL